MTPPKELSTGDRRISNASSNGEAPSQNTSDGSDIWIFTDTGCSQCIPQWDIKYDVDKADNMTEAAFLSSDVAGLKDAINFAGKAANACRDDPALCSRAMDILAQAHATVFDETGEVEHAEKAFDAWQESVNICPPTDPGRHCRIRNLAYILHVRFELTADVAYLDKSITLKKEVLTMNGPFDQSHDLDTLSASLYTRFQVTADPADLDRSIALSEESIPLANPRDRSERMRGLAISLGTRFNNTARLSDLERGIGLLEEALVLSQSANARRDCLAELATALSNRYEETRNVVDLDRSIALYEEVLGLCTPTHIDRPSLLTQLAEALRNRSRLRRDVTYLDRAIKLEEEALALTPPNHVQQPRRLSNLAWMYSDCFDLSKDLDHLDKCISLHEQALHARLLEGVKRPHSLANLAHSLRTRFHHKSNIADLDRAIESAHAHSTLSIGDVVSQLREAANDLHSPSHDRLSATLSWINASTESHDVLFEAYTTMFDVLDTVITRGHSLESRYSQLTTEHCISQAKGRIADAVSFAISKGRPRDAVVFVERGHALLLAQVGHCRMPLDIVRTKDAELAAELESIGRQFERLLASKTKPTDFTTRSIADDPVAQSMRLTAQWNVLVEQARKLDGCCDFLRPTPFDSLQHGAHGGPVVFININKPLSHAIIVVRDGDPLVVPLPSATPEVVEVLTIVFHKARHQHPSNYYSALRKLWDIIVGPVVRLLEPRFLTGSRIWWCPSAAVAQLPLHAAGDYTRSAAANMKLLNVFVSSYTSSLGALVRAQRPISLLTSPAPSVVVISQPNTQGEAELNVKAEIAYICQNLPASTLLEGQDGTPDAVISRIPNHTWAHFSSHGYPGEDNPLRSYFPLHCGHLEVLDILQTQMPDAELAVLTACHTAHVDTKSPDEFLHLVEAMQFAGFRSVVGTLWEMDDMDGTFVVMEFYRQMFEELERGNRSAYTCAARALNKTVQKLRSKKVSPWRWVNYVHYGA
ncbi:hypothetical protein FRB99_001485 [Tulasnella sp. 403]|nr:hypothetical protein FRB99_001485 [Tulasnella sp. 403]